MADATDKPPLCRDCVWVRVSLIMEYGTRMCVSPLNPDDLDRITAISNRTEDGYCGPTGRLFQQREGA